MERPSKKKIILELLHGLGIAIPGVNIGGFGGVIFRFVFGNVFHVKEGLKLDWLSLGVLVPSGIVGFLSAVIVAFIAYDVVIVAVKGTGAAIGGAAGGVLGAAAGFFFGAGIGAVGGAAVGAAAGATAGAALVAP